jgi:hypothetical protein
MPADVAAWIREHAWTKPMRRQYRATPRFWHTCACQHGMSGYCTDGEHRPCGRGEPLPGCETYICNARDQVLHLPEPFVHPTLTAGGTHRSRRSTAMVWLADRVCRWRCPCTCHDSQVPGRAAAVVGETFDLFAQGGDDCG